MKKHCKQVLILVEVKVNEAQVLQTVLFGPVMMWFVLLRRHSWFLSPLQGVVPMGARWCGEMPFKIMGLSVNQESMATLR